MGETAHQLARAPIPAVASLRVDPERLQQLWAMRPAERVAAAREGRFTLGQMLQWASRRPREVPLIGVSLASEQKRGSSVSGSRPGIYLDKASGVKGTTRPGLRPPPSITCAAATPSSCST
jgi:hypothetical protein